VRGSFIFTALFFAASASLIFLRVKETRQGHSLPPGESYFSISIKRLVNTFKAVRHFRSFLTFIIAFLIYNDGILMALDFAAIIGAVLFGMNQTQLIIFMILVQATSALGAWLFGIIGERTGFKKALIFSLILMIAAIIWMIFAQNLTTFFIIGGLAGFALTGVQSISRTMTSLFAPESKATEFFSFFAVAGKSSSFLGPTIFGLLSAGVAARMEAGGMNSILAEQYGTRAGTITIAFFLVIGLVILIFVNEKRARKAAEDYVPEG